jgi:uncharacterized Zn finger protein (UPF0148 family)
VLDVACNANKQPLVQLYRSKDGDVACMIVLEVPSQNEFHDEANGGSQLMDV